MGYENAFPQGDRFTPSATTSTSTRMHDTPDADQILIQRIVNGRHFDLGFFGADMTIEEFLTSEQGIPGEYRVYPLDHNGAPIDAEFRRHIFSADHVVLLRKRSAAAASTSAGAAPGGGSGGASDFLLQQVLASVQREREELAQMRRELAEQQKAILEKQAALAVNATGIQSDMLGRVFDVDAKRNEQAAESAKSSFGLILGMMQASSEQERLRAERRMEEERVRADREREAAVERADRERSERADAIEAERRRYEQERQRDRDHAAAMIALQTAAAERERAVLQKLVDERATSANPFAAIVQTLAPLTPVLGALGIKVGSGALVPLIRQVLGLEGGDQSGGGGVFETLIREGAATVRELAVQNVKLQQMQLAADGVDDDDDDEDEADDESEEVEQTEAPRQIPARAPQPQIAARPANPMPLADQRAAREAVNRFANLVCTRPREEWRDGLIAEMMQTPALLQLLQHVPVRQLLIDTKRLNPGQIGMVLDDARAAVAELPPAMTAGIRLE